MLVSSYASKASELAQWSVIICLTKHRQQKPNADLMMHFHTFTAHTYSSWTSGCADLFSDFPIITSFEDDLLTNYILDRVMSLVNNFELQTFIKQPDQTWSEKKIHVLDDPFWSFRLKTYLMWWVLSHKTSLTHNNAFNFEFFESSILSI